MKIFSFLVPCNNLYLMCEIAEKKKIFADGFFAIVCCFKFKRNGFFFREFELNQGDK